MHTANVVCCTATVLIMQNSPSDAIYTCLHALPKYCHAPLFKKKQKKKLFFIYSSMLLYTILLNLCLPLLINLKYIVWLIIKKGLIIVSW